MTLNRSIALSLIVAVTAIAPSAALAKHGADDRPGAFDDNGGLRADHSRDAKRVAGKCTGNSTSKLKVKPDNGGLETEFEVDQNRNGVNGEASDQFVTTIQLTVPGSSTATLVKQDTTTQGNWIGAYGAQGYNVIGNAARYPAYATVTPAGYQFSRRFPGAIEQ